jgi:hypothetical protein
MFPARQASPEILLSWARKAIEYKLQRPTLRPSFHTNPKNLIPSLAPFEPFGFDGSMRLFSPMVGSLPSGAHTFGRILLLTRILLVVTNLRLGEHAKTDDEPK